MLILFEGDPGSGKTLFTTFINLMHHDLFTFVRANYEIKGIKNYRSLELDDLKDINVPTLITIDEAYTWLESRTAMNVVNRYLSYHLFQKRKRKIYFLLTAQLAESVDVRFRKMCTVLVECEFRKNRFHYQPYVIKRRNTRRFIKKKKAFTISLEKARKIFPFYETREIVESEALKDTIAQTMKAETKKKLTTSLILKMLKEQEKWTKAQIRGYLFDNGLSLKLTESVYLSYINVIRKKKLKTGNNTKKKKQKKKRK